MTRILSIAKNTFSEVIRQPIYLILLFTTLALTLLSPYVTMFAMLANNPLVKDMGLATLLLEGLLLAIFSANHAVSQEVESKTILTILSKPVSRSNFIFGKYLGLLMALFVAQYLLLLVLLPVVRKEITEAAYSKGDYPVVVGYLLATLFSFILAGFANFFYEKSFYSSCVLSSVPIFTMCFLLLGLIGPNWSLQPFLANLDFRLAIAGCFIFLATMLLCGFALLISTRLSPLPTLIGTLIFFFLGLFSDYLFGRFSQEHWLYRIAYGISPNFQIYLITDAILDERNIPLDYFIYLLGYTMTYLAGILALAIGLFHGRETR